MARRSFPSSMTRLGEAVADATILARLTRDLPGWLRTPISQEQALEQIRRRLRTRERSLVDVVRRAIYGNPRSPYLQLLQTIACEVGDFERLVAREGVEGALADLAAKGVYVAFDEFKGRREAVRGSARFQFHESDFDTPLDAPHFVGYTSGTRGRPGRVPVSLGYIDENASTIAAIRAARGLHDEHTVFWLTSPLSHLLARAKLGQRHYTWLRPLSVFPLEAHLGAHYLHLLGRVAGHDFPLPRYFDVMRPDLLAAWLDRRPRRGRNLVLNTMPSVAVRVAIAAREAGIDLTGVTFMLQGEPVTPARHQYMVESGAQVIVFYGTMETMFIGHSCAQPMAPDDLHFNSDRYALVGRSRPVVDGGPSVEAILLTTLTASAPKVCLNVEPGDYATVEKRACGCPLGTLGLTTHLSEVRSFEKLSGEGVTFVRSNLLQILEEVLPQRFGGSVLDYQIIEEEAPNSATRLVLRVSPSIGSADEGELRSALLAALSRGGIVDRHHAELLRVAGSVVVSREPPLASAAGKVLPFQLVRPASPAVTNRPTVNT